jgi:acetyltransferase EpsM
MAVKNELPGLVVVGSGGHGKVVLDAARRSGGFARFVFVDEDVEHAGSDVLGAQVLGGVETLSRLDKERWLVVLGIGANGDRRRLAEEIHELGWRFASVVHPGALIGASVDVAPGAVVLAGAVINACAQVGEHAIVNSRAVVEHDCVVEGFVHVAPGACLGGGVRVRRCAIVGMQAAVLPGLEIGEDAIVGAGATVTRNVPPRTVVAGVPARPV